MVVIEGVILEDIDATASVYASDMTSSSPLSPQELVSGGMVYSGSVVEGYMLLNLTTQHGKISLPTTRAMGLSVVTGDYTGTTTLTVKGTLQQLNHALSRLTYTPPADYYGQDYLGK